MTLFVLKKRPAKLVDSAILGQGQSVIVSACNLLHLPFRELLDKLELVNVSFGEAVKSQLSMQTASTDEQEAFLSDEGSMMI